MDPLPWRVVRHEDRTYSNTHVHISLTLWTFYKSPRSSVNEQVSLYSVRWSQISVESHKKKCAVFMEKAVSFNSSLPCCPEVIRFWMHKENTTAKIKRCNRMLGMDVTPRCQFDVCTVHHPIIWIWTNKMHKILVIRLYFLLDALHVSDYICPSSGTTL